MLYIFHVETGTMMTFDMNLALESVGHLKRIICKEYKIPEEKQVLLISGGESLEPTTRVCSYSAGTDTSPIFLFSKVVIESSSPPLPSVDYGSSPDMKNCVDSCIDMPPTYETVVHRAQLAQQFHDLAKKQTSTCEKLVHDQHLQQQGWAAVVANLDDITSAFRNRTQLFVQNFNQYLKTRGYHVEILHNFSHHLSLLSKIPVLPALLSDIPHHVEGSLHNDSTAFSLLHWINSKDNQSSLEQMADQCLRGLEQFSESMLDVLHGEINDTLEKLDNVDMKEVKGLEARLYGLEKLMFEAHRIVREQSDLAQAFVQNQTRAGNIGDTSILPDLCASHSRQLQLMLKNHMQLEGILQRCIDAKKELSSNLHIRLGWIMYVEGRISDLDNKLSIYHENLKRLKRHLDVVEQIHLTPQVYVAAVVEVVRRRTFSTAFLQWANSLTEHTMHLHKVEVTTRKTFNEKIANHFLHALFPGMEDSPPPFALNRPEPFDQDLPNVFEEDIEKLKQKLPEFAELLVISSKELIQCVAAVPPLSEYISKEKQVSEHELKKYCDVDKDVLLYDEELLTHVDFKQTHNLLGCATGSKKLPVRDWKEVSVEGFEHIGAVERTDTFPKPHKHKNVDFEQKMAMKERQKIFRTQSDGDIKTISKDFSSSDLCFVPSGHPTADFYIDDSMTSSCTDSNAASGPGRGISSLKPKHELVASLQKQLMEKNATLLKTREELQSTKLQLQRFQSTVTTLEELTKQVQQSLRLDLANLQDEVLQRREEVIENILAVSSKVQETIEHLNIQLGSSQEEAALELVNKEHRVELQYYQQLLDVEMHKLEDAHQEIEVYQQQLMSQNDVIDNLKQEFEAGIKKIQSECENERKELEQKLILEQELELEAVRMELRRVQSGEILELTQ
ncbi:RB1-inducible coiled-coil protein 1-like, partial [Limulus polyphemus]|uniref:RB1-inducible coiled-coil protein 1-like n=1 Tax=Limulus polyphemus TaxID=6850 RepID=A0ABM1BYM1_LIMPO